MHCYLAASRDFRVFPCVIPALDTHVIDELVVVSEQMRLRVVNCSAPSVDSSQRDLDLLQRAVQKQCAGTYQDSNFLRYGWNDVLP